jgi:hypothetical protein
MPAGQPLNPATLRRMQLGYADLDTPVAVTAKRLGVAEATMYRTARQCRWKSRREARLEGRRAAAAGAVLEAARSEPSDPLASIARLTPQHVAAVDRALASGNAADLERHARALATHVRTLASMQKMQAARPEEPEPDDEPPPRSLAELRDELRRHLERVQAEEWSDRELCGDPDAA